jgi:hypothetical protein
MLLLVMNLSEINILSNPYSNPLKAYTDNLVISFLYKAAIIFDASLMFVIILFLYYGIKKLEKQKLLLRNVIVVNSLILLFLIWFEIYFGSTFYYGEVQRSINNGGLLGSVVFCLFVLSLFDFENLKAKSKVLLFSIVSLMVLLIHYFLYEALKYKWKILI